MTVQDTINNVKASFEMEGFKITLEDEQRGREILTGVKDADELIKEISSQYIVLS